MTAESAISHYLMLWKGNIMTLQVLVSTMYQSDYSMLEKMNIQSDAIVVNQCEKNEITEFDYNGYRIKWISLAERGVGLSRNTALMRASADILLFADDDIVYQDGYAEKVIQEFASNSEADLIVFNLQSLNPMRTEYINTKEHRLHFFNSLRYGACKIAVRREILFRKNIYFSLLFGGGARYQAGEDNLFITTALRKKCCLIASTVMLGTVAQEGSSWFNGYDRNYYKDRGALFSAMYGRFSVIMLLLFELKHLVRKSHTKLKLSDRIKAQLEGIKEFGSHSF